MPRGGRRAGAGRKPGSTNKKRSAALVRKAHESGEIMPLEVQLEAMRYHYGKWQETGDELSLKEANMIAMGASPYLHPRLAAIDQRTTMETGDTLTMLLRSIDGTTTGITRGLAASRSLLEARQPVHNLDEGGEEDPLPNELGAAGAACEPS